jgi:homoserine kinase type II
MTKADTHLRQDEIALVMPHYTLGRLLFSRPAGGTANASAVVVTASGQYVLKRRNPRYCDPAQLVYDHHVLSAVRAAGLPAPEVVKTRSGSRWLEHDGRIYELYRFIEGTTEAHPDEDQLSAAGDMLAQFHRATERLAPPGGKQLGRLWNPRKAADLLRPLQTRAMDGHLGSLLDNSATEATERIELLLASLQQIRMRLTDETYWRLPQTIIHADWHPANVKYQGTQIVGIFDFDWVDRQPRMVDVADGMLYFAGTRPTAGDGSDIWRLTEAPLLERQRMQTFMHAYASRQPLTAQELAALPDLMAVRWVYSRVDAADRKIVEEDQLRFLLRQIEQPLQWLAQHHNDMQDGVWWE